MNRDTVIALAREAGCALWEDGSVSPALERFAALVAAAEREECARMLERRVTGILREVDAETKACAAAIRSKTNPVK